MWKKSFTSGLIIFLIESIFIDFTRPLGIFVIQKVYYVYEVS